MGKEQITRISVTAAAIAFMLLGILTRSWWSLEIKVMGTVDSGAFTGTMDAGLRTVKACVNGMCQTAPWDAMPATIGMAFRTCASVTFFGCILGTLVLALGVFLRETQGVDHIAKWGSTVCAVLAPFAIMAVLMVPSGGNHPLIHVDTSVGYSFFVTLLGLIGGAVAGRMNVNSGWGDTGVYQPVGANAIAASRRDLIDNLPSVYPGPANTANTTDAPAQASAGQPALQSYEYDAKIRDATSTPPPTTSFRDLAQPKGASSTADAATDSMRTTLRFVARSVEIMSGAGISVVMEDGSVRDLLWSQVARVVARRLPPDAPYNKTLFVDIVPGVAPRTPVRMLPSTQANYTALPGGAAMGSTENLRALGKMIAEARPGAVEPHSESFFLQQQQPAQFQAIKQFADYDAQYGA